MDNFYNERYVAKEIIKKLDKEDLVSAGNAIKIVSDIEKDYHKLYKEVMDYLERNDPDDLVCHRIFFDMYYPILRETIEEKMKNHQVNINKHNIVKEMINKSLNDILNV